jgi:hypothetical protein
MTVFAALRNMIGSAEEEQRQARRGQSSTLHLE